MYRFLGFSRLRSDASATPGALSSSLSSDEVGAVFVEYVIVLVLVSAVGVAGIIPLGVALSRYFDAQRTVLNLPFP